MDLSCICASCFRLGDPRRWNKHLAELVASLTDDLQKRKCISWFCHLKLQLLLVCDTQTELWILCWALQVVRQSQSGAARRRHPQPPAVVQAGTGPPRARGGAGQDDPLPQTGPRYRVFTAPNNSCRPHLEIRLRGLAQWHVIVSRDTLRAQNVSSRIPAAISDPQASPSGLATE